MISLKTRNFVTASSRICAGLPQNREIRKMQYIAYNFYSLLSANKTIVVLNLINDTPYTSICK